MRVTVVVVNFNGGAAILDCLAALAGQSLSHHVLVVDNASTDGSLRACHDAFPNAEFLPLRRNVGFARAVNLAAARTEGDVLVTLNPDTLPDPDFVEQMVGPFNDNPRLASVAGTLVFASDNSVIASAGVQVHRNGVALDARIGERDDARDRLLRPVFGASGGAAAYRLTPFRAVGGMCEPFFLYLEDVDLAWRLRLSGWESVNAASARAKHLYSASAVEGSAFKRRLLARNRIWTLARCLPSELWQRDRWAILGFDILAAGYGTIRRDGASLDGRLAAVAGLPLRLRERRIVQASATATTAEIDRWLLPAISSRELLGLRKLTGRLAAKRR